MARYIDADALMEVARKHKMTEVYPEWTDRNVIVALCKFGRFFKKIIEEAPAADVEKVVRCKDCDVPHNKWTGCPHLNGLIPPPNHYCACGTPKERGGEK